ncbi:hypothetical protein TIFTF001_018557 [Ficus carica]|uniref:RRM domain-containing protein n=1 Tax=Ficus carica TaxID=3494 RepID=A0AA88AS28_FICCA|nr:hypothetical protein TIFTF001_018557 [Ficus carica]
MGTPSLGLDLTIQVLNLSPRLTLADINSFFSCCGTVDHIQISRSNTTSAERGKGNKEEASQSALVTFTQPYAFQTALLLDDAILADQPISVLPAGVVPIPILSDEDVSHQTEKKRGGYNAAEGHIAWKGAEMLKKKESELQKKRRLVGVVGEQTISGIGGAAEAAAGRVCGWLSDAVEKASMFASSRMHLGTTAAAAAATNITHK